MLRFAGDSLPYFHSSYYIQYQQLHAYNKQKNWDYYYRCEKSTR